MQKKCRKKNVNNPLTSDGTLKNIQCWITISKSLHQFVQVLLVLMAFTRDYTSPSFAGLCYMAPWTNWRFFAILAIWALFGDFFGPFWSLDNLW